MKKFRHKRCLWWIWIAALMPCAAGQRAHWDNPEVYRMNKVQPHDRIVPDGRWSISLDGEWRYSWFASESLATLTPTRWEVATLPLKEADAVVGEVSGAVVYTRHFALPTRWSGRRTIIKFGATGSGIYLYINGREVGYSQDSKTPAEWDITKYLQAGTNRVAIKEVKKSDGVNLDCRHSASGLTRSIELYSVPQTYITDFKIEATLDTVNWSTGHIDLMVDLNHEVQGGSLEVQINGRTFRHNFEARDWFASITGEVGMVEPWSDSVPNLYPLTLRLLDALGRETERITKQVGFRNVSVRGGSLRLNGRRVRLLGVVRHEPAGQSLDSMRREIALYKSEGVNAVRTCHHPADERWYDLCDSAGLLVWDEANIEPASDIDLSDKKWLNPVLDRVFNLYKRDRNHACVVVWSVGREGGYCADEAYRFLKGKDAQRPVVQQGMGYTGSTDMIAPEGPTPQRMATQGRLGWQERPFVAASYGDDREATSECIDALWSYASLQGGFAELRHLGDRYLRPRVENAEWEPDEAESGEPVVYEPEPAEEATAEVIYHGSAVEAIVGNREPDAERSHGYPWTLTDGLHGVAGVAEGWTAYQAADTVELVLMMNDAATLTALSVGVCHAPARGALLPRSVQACWSGDGRRWGDWEQLEVLNPPADPYEGLQRLQYQAKPHRARGVRFVKFRIVGREKLQSWHRLSSDESWLMIDEIEVDRKR